MIGNGNTMESAKALLEEMLDNDAYLPARAVIEAGEDIGISRWSMMKAKQRFGVESCHEGFGPGSRWFWHWPDARYRVRNT
jgi:hypothetical protein